MLACHNKHKKLKYVLIIKLGRK